MKDAILPSEIFCDLTLFSLALLEIFLKLFKIPPGATHRTFTSTHRLHRQTIRVTKCVRQIEK